MTVNGFNHVDHANNSRNTLVLKAGKEHMTEDETDDEITPPTLLDGRAETLCADHDNQEQEEVRLPALKISRFCQSLCSFL